MKERHDGRRHVFEERPVVLPGILAAGATALAWRALPHLDRLADADQETWGALLGALLLALGALLLFRRDRFVFDRESRTLSWSKWSLLRHRRGSVPFDEVTGVLLDSSAGDAGLDHRVLLRTRSGSLPLTETYSGNLERCRELAASLGRILDLEPTASSPEEEAQELVDQGRKLDAIRRLREEQGLSLSEAKREVDRQR